MLLENAFKFISPHENTVKQTYVAYLDGSRWSIGFGTISYPGEIINYDQAVQRSKEYIENDINELDRQTWFSILPDEKKISILDFAYQAGKYGDKFRNLRDKIVSGAVTENDFKTGYENQSRINNRWNMFQTISGTPVIQFATMDSFWILMIILSGIAFILKKYVS